MRKVMNIVVVAVLATEALVLGQASGDAAKVLAAVREAMGGDKKLGAVTSLTATGQYQQSTGEQVSTGGEFEMAMSLPDKYYEKKPSVVTPFGTLSRTVGFNADGLINEVDQPPQQPGMVMRFGGPGGAGASPDAKEAARKAALLSAKLNFAQMTLGMFAQSFPSYPLEFVAAGTADSKDGKADVIDVKGADFAAKLFVDQKTHLPLMLTWQDKEPLAPVTRMMGAGPGGAAGGGGRSMSFTNGPGGAATTQMDVPMGPDGKPDMTKLQQMMDDQRKAAEAARKMVEFRIYYSDYKVVDGVKLPFHYARSVDGKATEDVTFDKVKINPKIDPKKFDVSK